VKPPTSRNQRQRGAVMIWMALFLLAILGFVALGIDTAKVAATRTQLQNAADAAALAGASAIDFDTGTLNQDTSVVRAQFTAMQNKAFVDDPKPVVVQAADVTFPLPTDCKVVVRRTAGVGGEVVTHVAQVLGIKSLSLNATATARVEPLDAICEGLLPMAPVEPPSGGFQTGCANEYSLKVGAGEGEQGNYELLDYADCEEGPCADVGGGGAEIRCLVENGYGCCIEIGDEFVLTEPGTKIGPFRQGMQARWDADTDRRENICYSDYTGNGKRVVHVPGVETFDVNGKKNVRITGFYAFFLKRRPTGGGQQELIGEFLYDVAPGEAGGDDSEGTLYTIRLVQ
jgi:hypothetical protein